MPMQARVAPRKVIGSDNGSTFWPVLAGGCLRRLTVLEPLSPRHWRVSSRDDPVDNVHGSPLPFPLST